MSLALRCHDPERMDEPSVPTHEMRRTLVDLDWINRFLGGWSASRALLEARIREHRGGTLSILDVGAGSAGTLGELRRRARRWGARASFVSLDLHAAACDVAREREHGAGIGVVRGDARKLPFADGAFDYVHASLFLHHFPDDAIGEILGEMRRVAREGVVLNDLHRHVVALAAIRAIAGGLRMSPLVRHDGPLSVRRGFRRDEITAWRRIPGFETLGVRWRWPFRWIAWWFADGGTPDARA